MATKRKRDEKTAIALFAQWISKFNNTPMYIEFTETKFFVTTETRIRR